MSDQHKRIRPLKENAAGKVVADRAGSRWEWDIEQSDDTQRLLGETSRLLRKLHNHELAIERTDITPNPLRRERAHRERQLGAENRAKKPLQKTGGRDAGGGFDPYDNAGKPPRR